MMGIRVYVAAIIGYRSFSSNSGSRSGDFGQSSYKYARKQKKNTARSAKIKWTDEQKEALACVREGHSVFVTGSAGTGKSVLIKHMINVLRKIHGRSKVFVTASTGIAACALKGQTLHSFSGYGFGNLACENLLDKIMTDKKACGRWKKVGALIIDEISMVDADMFEKLEFVARGVRGSNKVWGGIQLVVSGDFLQLPPVIHNWNSSGREFAFEADCWDASFSKQVELTKVFRQSDAQLIKLLQDIRRGDVDHKDLEILEQRSFDELDSSVVRLYPRIEDVNEVNETRIESLGEQLITYEAADGGLNNWKNKLKGGIAPDQLVLCKGARVMLIKNLNTWSKLCNGATGTVVGFVSVEGKNAVNLSPSRLLPVVKFDSGIELEIEPQRWEIYDGEVAVAWRFQIPLVLAWALSIHKSQGMTLDRLHTDLSKAFGCGMVYVALSRVRSLEGLYLSGFSPTKIKANPKVLQFYKRFARENIAKDEDVDDVANKSESIEVPPEKTSTSHYGFSLLEFLVSRQKR